MPGLRRTARIKRRRPARSSRPCRGDRPSREGRLAPQRRQGRPAAERAGAPAMAYARRGCAALVDVLAQSRGSRGEADRQAPVAPLGPRAADRRLHRQSARRDTQRFMAARAGPVVGGYHQRRLSSARGRRRRVDQAPADRQAHRRDCSHTCAVGSASTAAGRPSLSSIKVTRFSASRRRSTRPAGWLASTQSRPTRCATPQRPGWFREGSRRARRRSSSAPASKWY